MTNVTDGSGAAEAAPPSKRTVQRLFLDAVIAVLLTTADSSLALGFACRRLGMAIV